MIAAYLSATISLFFLCQTTISLRAFSSAPKLRLQEGGRKGGPTREASTTALHEQAIKIKKLLGNVSPATPSKDSPPQQVLESSWTAEVVTKTAEGIEIGQAAPAAATVVSADDGVSIGKGFPSENIPLGDKVPFETELFQGVFYLRLRNSPSPDEDGESHSAYFDGRKNLYQLVIQGRFKRSGLNFSDVLLGGVFEKSLKGMPPAAMFRAIRSFTETVQPGIVFDIAADHPKVLLPLGACQTISVDPPGYEPVDFNNITENNALLGDSAPARTRRKLLSKPKTAKDYTIDPNLVYTIENCDEALDLATFHNVLFGGKMKVDLLPVLDGQSFPMGMYIREDLQCVYKFALTHNR